MHRHRLLVPGVLTTLALVSSLFAVGAPTAGANPSPDIYGYEIVESGTLNFSGNGWAGWSCPPGKVVLGGGVSGVRTLTSRPAGPNSVWPHYTYGANEYGWVAQSAEAGPAKIWVVCAFAPAGYGIVESSPMNFGSTGWGGWSCPAGDVVLGGGVQNLVARSSRPAGPNSIWPHYTYGATEYGWVAQDAGPGSAGTKIAVVCADPVAGYQIVESAPLNYGPTGAAGWSCPSDFVTGGGVQNLVPRSSRPAGPGTVTDFGYVYGPNEYGWLANNGENVGTIGSRIVPICAEATASAPNSPPTVDAGGGYVGEEGSPVALDGNVTDPDAGDTITTTWTYAPVTADTGAVCTFADASSVDTSVTCTDDGTYTLTLTASDGVNTPVSDTATLTLANVEPSVTINSPSDYAVVAVGSPVSLSASFADPGSNDIHTCSVNWGDAPANSGIVTESGGIGTCSDSHSYGTPGIYDVTATVLDDDTGAGSDTVSIVVYDPNGGFVTGGGWINSPPYAMPEWQDGSVVWQQGFESDTAGWLDASSSWYGTVSRVASGTGGITSASGGWHAVMEGDADSGPFSRFDGYRSVWPGTWMAEIDVYLDPAWASGTGFDYSVAANGTDGNHQRDYIFHVTKDTSTGKLLLAGSNNTNFAPREDLESINHYEVMTAGWYTLQHVFRDQGGALAVDLNLVDSAGNVLFTETRFNAADTIPAEVGGNRYSWFTFINVSGGIATDNHELWLGPTGRANFGFVAKYKKGATVPDGSTEFQFQAGNLNFHSSSYEWLVVNKASKNAQFKGTGTVNGSGNYGFMLWATDGSPDTFRIKIWDKDNGDAVVYDNGAAQPIAGGSIVVHTK